MAWVCVNSGGVELIFETEPHKVAYSWRDNEGKISFAHRVDTTVENHYRGWNIPGVEYWMSFNNPSEF